ncbi:MAG: hypothetical protein L0241_19940 [Planctomycetia bacterium]|nr:hypothetical protein [Planctomycetia bacterium]
MTEVDWLTGSDFAAQAQFASGQLSARRQRLLAAGFCRAVKHLFDHPDLNDALAVIEDHADGLASVAEVEKARQRCRVIAVAANDSANNAADSGTSDQLQHAVRNQLAWALAYAASPLLTVSDVGRHAAGAAVEAHTGAVLMAPVPQVEFDAATAEQAIIMRTVVWEVVGNPFRTVSFSASWRTDTAMSLARQMYESREFSAMPILADALQDAGCDNEDLLAHCRDTKLVHLRGCWVLDCVLGKG